MENIHPLYQCYPSVVCAGKEAEISIFPKDPSRIFRPERSYRLSIMGLWEDQADYHDPIAYDQPFRVEEGCLKFSFRFEREQEYALRLIIEERPPILLYLYAVEEDLYARRPLKGDLHSHTYYSDGKDGLTVAPAVYREEGYDFVAITDHNRMYPSQLAAEFYKDIPLGLHIMRGEEVHTPGSLVHIVHVGGEKSVCAQYIEDDAAYCKEVAEIAATLQRIPEQYRERVAKAHWACRKIKEAGGLAIFAHPFWCPQRYNESEEFLKLLMEERLFSAFEVLGGIKTRSNNQQVALWQEQARMGNKMAPVGSSDSHNHDFAIGKFGRRFTYVFAKENTTEAILEAIGKGYCVAGELPMTADDEPRFYGDLRLVMFAQYLFENYFAQTRLLCFGEGMLMRRYAEGEEVGAALSALAPTVENYYKKFFGKEKAEGVSARCRDFWDRALACQRKGPATKGSHLIPRSGKQRQE